jgi:hypothetical protein
MNQINQSLRAIERARKQQHQIVKDLIDDANRQASKLLISHVFCATMIAIVLLGWIYG